LSINVTDINKMPKMQQKKCKKQTKKQNVDVMFMLIQSLGE